MSRMSRTLDELRTRPVTLEAQPEANDWTDMLSNQVGRSDDQTADTHSSADSQDVQTDIV